MFQLCRKDRCERSDRTTRYECITERTNIMRKTLTTLLAAALAVSSLALTPISARGPVTIIPEPQTCDHYYSTKYRWQGWQSNDEYMHSYHIYTTYECIYCGSECSEDTQTDAGWHSCDAKIGTEIRDGRTVTIYRCYTCGGMTVG